MKRIAIIILITIMLCACQPTPEEAIVIPKNQEVMVDKAKDEIPREEQMLALKERIGAPDRFRYTYQEGFVSLSIDAEVSVPDAELPIVRVFPDNFDQNTANRFWATLIGDAQMYEYDSALTKDSIKRQMEYLVRIIDGEISDKDSMETVEEAQAELEELEKQYANAPDTVPCVRSDATLKTAYIETKRNPRMAKYTYISGTSMESGTYFQLVNNLDNKETLFLRDDDGERIKPVLRNANIQYGNKNAPENACDRIIAKCRANDTLPDELVHSFQMTPHEAYAAASTFLQSVGLNDRFDISDILLLDGNLNGETIYAYRVACTRSVRGISCLCAIGVPDISASDDVYRPIWNYEQLVLLIGKDGICSVSWNSPYAESDVIAEQTKLLPFSEIQSIAEKMLPIILKAQADGETTDKASFSYRIDKAVLGLWRISEQNDIEKGLLTPVWGFYAFTQETSRFGEITTNYAPILLINAVDGSIIDPQRGY